MKIGLPTGPAKLCTVAVALGASALLAACSSSSSGPKSSSAPPTSSGGASAGATTSGSATAANCSSLPSGPIKSYNILPLTGPLASAGGAQKSADATAVSVFNEHETICGHKVEVDDLDDKGDPATALNYARQLVADKHDLMFNDSFGEVQDAIHPYFMKNHVVTFSNISVGALIGQPNNPSAFSPGPSNAQYAKTMAGYAKSHNENDLGLITDQTTFANELTSDVKSDAASDGLTIKATETYSPTAVDLSTPLTKLKQAGVTTLVITGQTALPALASSLKQIGWSPAVIGWGGFGAYGVPASALPANTVDFCYTPYSTTLLNAINTELLTAQQKATGLNSGVQNVLLPYATLLVYKHVIESTGSTDGAKIAAAIQSLQNFPTNIPGLNLSFSSTNHFGYPDSSLSMCTLKTAKFDLFEKAS